MKRSEALDIIRKNWPDGRVQLQEALLTLAPELKVSEDERIRGWIIRTLKSLNSSPVQIDGAYEMMLPAIAWLERQGSQILANSAKTCKDEQNTAWSEEDETKVDDIRRAINELLTQNESWGFLEDALDWLKALKARHTWKPSDEQMEALKHIADGWATSDSERMNINALYNDLKKLTE